MTCGISTGAGPWETVRTTSVPLGTCAPASTETAMTDPAGAASSYGVTGVAEREAGGGQRGADVLGRRPRRGPSGTTVISGPFDTESSTDAVLEDAGARHGVGRDDRPGWLRVEDLHGRWRPRPASSRRSVAASSSLADDVGHGGVGTGSDRRVPPRAGRDERPAASSDRGDPAPPATTPDRRGRRLPLLGGDAPRARASRRRWAGRRSCRAGTTSRRAVASASDGESVTQPYRGRRRPWCRGRRWPGAARSSAGRRRGGRAWPRRGTRGSGARA